MLESMGMASMEDLYSSVPSELRLKKPLDLDPGLSEIELVRTIGRLAAGNKSLDDLVCFVGAGAYDRYVPSVVDHVISRSEFYTAYTPYQPEISQGTLQAIFEFQTMIASLTGLDVANASMYDAATALAEAAIMSARHTRRNGILLVGNVHPDCESVLATYSGYGSLSLVHKNYHDYESALDGETACVIVGYPDFLGEVHDLEPIFASAKSVGALSIALVMNPAMLALLRSPGDAGADIVVGEGQSFGTPPYFGGPYLGLMAVRESLVRKMPGRVVGQTVDMEGTRSFALTLQTREQHIRREKATSNICSNEGLNALAAAVYLTLLGEAGLVDVAVQSASKAAYLRAKLARIGLETNGDAVLLDEFAVTLPTNASRVNEKMLEAGFLGGYALDGYAVDGASEKLLVCTTEKRTLSEIDRYADALEEAVK
jgi:glycine dehydrogenase subunit 1